MCRCRCVLSFLFIHTLRGDFQFLLTSFYSYLSFLYTLCMNYIFPFRDLTNYELQNEIFSLSCFSENSEFKKLLTSSLLGKDVNDIEFNHSTPEQLNVLAKRCSNVNLSIFHINIRSLNANP